MKKALALATLAVVALTLTVGAMAAQQIVTLKDGRTFTGTVTKMTDGYQVATPGGVVVFSFDQVAKVQDVVTTADEFKDRLAKIDQKDAEALYGLAGWARDKGMFVEARDLLNKALAVKPDFENARLMLKLVEIRLASATAPAAGTGVPAVGATSQGVGVTPPPPAGGGLSEMNLLTLEDIYRIRIVELREDEKVQVAFRNKAIDKFIEANRGKGPFVEKGAEEQFRALADIDKLHFIMKNVDRKDPIYDDILIKSDPAVMQEFKTKVWPLIAQNCATASCHGGVAAGSLRLYNTNLSDERILYTNFFILHSYQNDQGKLIDRENPEKSLLLLYGLPANLVATPHPKNLTAPWNNSKDDPNFLKIQAWVKGLKFPFLTGYRVDYKPGATTAPAK
jgi:tetratricopeptide (TPR) repeat protein